MNPKRITSRDNPTFKLLCELAGSGRERRKQGRTLLDGIHLVAAFHDAIGVPELLAVSDHGAGDVEIRSFLEANPGMPWVSLTDTLLREISPVATPSGIVAVVPLPRAPVLELAGKSCVALDAVQDAGNVGSILRSAAAAGIGNVLLGKGCAQAWSPRVLRAAMGAHFVLKIFDQADLAAVLGGYDGSVITTRLDAHDSLYDYDLSGPVAWLFGNEGAGLSQQFDGLAGRAVRIPMAGRVESLNVAAAAAVCLFEEQRQKLVARRGQ